MTVIVLGLGLGMVGRIIAIQHHTMASREELAFAVANLQQAIESPRGRELAELLEVLPKVAERLNRCRTTAPHVVPPTCKAGALTGMKRSTHRDRTRHLRPGRPHRPRARKPGGALRRRAGAEPSTNLVQAGRLLRPGHCPRPQVGPCRARPPGAQGTGARVRVPARARW
ncbi:MAG: hypothetical protein KC464_08175 [Myxococcales bacterium]|nr:hypothetical protein [Myxococcales bacterium]